MEIIKLTIEVSSVLHLIKNFDQVKEAIEELCDKGEIITGKQELHWNIKDQEGFSKYKKS